MKIQDRIFQLVENEPITNSKLGAILVNEYTKLSGKEVHQEIDKLVSSGHLIEVEYFLPNRMKNKLYFPRETKLRLSVN